MGGGRAANRLENFQVPPLATDRCYIIAANYWLIVILWNDIPFCIFIRELIGEEKKNLNQLRNQPIDGARGTLCRHDDCLIIYWPMWWGNIGPAPLAEPMNRGGGGPKADDSAPLPAAMGRLVGQSAARVGRGRCPRHRWPVSHFFSADTPTRPGRRLVNLI